MNLRPILAALAVLAVQYAPIPALADPLHARQDGTYWHHDSGWLFPARVGEFERVGVPQDVAGSPDAVAHYARMIGGARVVLAVDVFQAQSAAEATTLESATAALIADSGVGTPLITGEIDLNARGYKAVRVEASSKDTSLPLRALYYVDTGAWRVRIRADIPRTAGDLTAELDAFVRAQRWETLP